ncbi:hypothetical protein GCM10011574_69310 [Microbispora bryophytorum]|uniref:Secreted protein n=1 Tax=Microbispora bryophytorum TaxID=1460882 RepID=A0A8H9H773_9ACTN|nr:hypothetical protein GCM10011574_69310 [Microbispora bryophytorum]
MFSPTTFRTASGALITAIVTADAAVISVPTQAQTPVMTAILRAFFRSSFPSSSAVLRGFAGALISNSGSSQWSEAVRLRVPFLDVRGDEPVGSRLSRTRHECRRIDNAANGNSTIYPDMEGNVSAGTGA